MPVNGFNPHVKNCHLNAISQMLFIFIVKRHHISVVISEGMFEILLEFVTILENKKEGMDRKDVSARID